MASDKIPGFSGQTVSFYETNTIGFAIDIVIAIVIVIVIATTTQFSL